MAYRACQQRLITRSALPRTILKGPVGSHLRSDQESCSCADSRVASTAPADSPYNDGAVFHDFSACNGENVALVR
jgi:hypothetical protein